MGPLVALDQISNEMNLLLAMLIGFGFGFVLEQAGFSSSRKLAGVFYGYDFTVLRVFFTAGATALTGLFVMDYYGLIDVSLVYVNPFYVQGSIVGGVIMGVGFILGGFCPGTSAVAMMTGSKDAMVFFLGLFIGVFVFAEAFPVFEDIYYGGYLGSPYVFESLGLPRGLFAFLLILIAVVSFVATWFVEQKVNDRPVEFSFAFMKTQKYHSMAIVLALVVGLVLISLPTRQEKLMANLDDDKFVEAQDVATITADELAFRIMDHDKTIQVIDMRDFEKFDKRSLPGALNLTLEAVISRDWMDVLGNRKKTKVYVSDIGLDAKRAAILATRAGYKNNLILVGGCSNFKNAIFGASSEQHSEDWKTEQNTKFRLEASKTIQELIKTSKAPRPKPKKVKKVQGGC